MIICKRDEKRRKEPEVLISSVIAAVALLKIAILEDCKRAMKLGMADWAASCTFSAIYIKTNKTNKQ